MNYEDSSKNLDALDKELAEAKAAFMGKAGISDVAKELSEQSDCYLFVAMGKFIKYKHCGKEVADDILRHEAKENPGCIIYMARVEKSCFKGLFSDDLMVALYGKSSAKD